MAVRNLTPTSRLPEASELAEICNGNKLTLKLKIDEAIHERRYQFRRALALAQNDLFLIYARNGLRLAKKKNLERLNLFINTAKQLQEHMHEGQFNFLDFLDCHYFYDTPDINTIDKKIINWEELNQLLAMHTNEFERIALKKKNERIKGRPKTLSGLSEYIFEAAIVYEASTNKKFSIDEHRVKGVPIPITEGMRFAEVCMKAIYKSESNMSDSYKEIYGNLRYTSANFQNACVYAARRLRSSKNNRI